MTQFLNEISRIANSRGLKPDESDGLLAISMHGRPICRVADDGGIFYRPVNIDTHEAKEAYQFIRNSVDIAHEYVRAIEQAPALKRNDLPESYQRLCDFNGYVLAGKEFPQNQGYMFVTWEYSYDRADVMLGHYFMNQYDKAKEDFACRAGIIPKEKLLNDEQFHQIFEAVHFVRKNNPDLTFEQGKALDTLMHQIQKAVPNAAFIEDLGETQAPTLNL